MRKRSEPVRRPWKLTTKLMLTSIYQGMKRIIFISVFKNLKSFRADVEKHRMTSNIKRQQMDDSKNEYANQLQKTNELQVGRN